ncbi:atp-binding cassette g family transporter abcg89 [Cystoisospora suis]|uniref:Atp-binding cassette g family transporter abcg89 n=1 Tax=Cystoisospora suis TaxID=483139 RepID=A0A2C6L5M4_9APIC|nr:atp-binding cassette g family transporter abcg89 [Cystoisospora suis]
MVVLQEMQMTVTLFSGFMVKLDQLSKFWVWLVYLSPFKYTLSCFTLTIFLDATIISDDGPSVKGQQVSVKERGYKQYRNSHDRNTKK